QQGNCPRINSIIPRSTTTLWRCSEKQGKRVVDIEKIEDYPFFGEGLDPRLVSRERSARDTILRLLILGCATRCLVEKRYMRSRFLPPSRKMSRSFPPGSCILVVYERCTPKLGTRYISRI